MIKVKLFKQSKGYCGPASLKMLLSHYGINKSEKVLAKLTGATRKQGCPPQSIVKIAKRLGFRAYYKENCSIKELKRWVGSGIPVIVGWFSPEEDGHYSVAVGFHKDIILLADPHFGKLRKIKTVKFVNRWFGFDEPPNKSNLFLRGMIVIKR